MKVLSYEMVDWDVLNKEMTEGFGCRLDHCEIDVGTLLDPLSPDGTATVVNLSSLDALKVPYDTFLPDNIYVRSNMRQVFALFIKDAADGVNKKARTILMGSPGIGKSILFFLAALGRSRQEVTIYFRRTTADFYVSVFLMIPRRENRVDVLFTRSLDKRRLNEGLGSFHMFLQDTILGIDRRSYCSFVNGPRDGDEANTIDQTYDFLCSEYGNPWLPMGLGKGFRTWILDGWTREDITAALAAAGHDERKALNAYWLCGGNIRDALQACTPRGFDLVKNVLDHVVTFTPAAMGELALRGHSPRHDEADRVRTLFRTKDWFRRMIEVHTIHLVDSRYIFGRLRKSLHLGTMLLCYELARHVNNSAIRGLYFENIIHMWFEKAKPAPIEDVYWSPGAVAEVALELVKPNVYWIQSSCDYPFITSWVIVGETLCLLHVTVKQGLDLNFQVFIEEFVSSIEKLVTFRTVSLYVLVPKREIYPASFTEVLALPAPDFRSASRPMQFNSFRHNADIAYYARIDESSRQLPFSNLPEAPMGGTRFLNSA
jgi:hypothetical protein